jgi:ABC-type multidrug transport system fused ATPase/permease subunit
MLGAALLAMLGSGALTSLVPVLVGQLVDHSLSNNRIHLSGSLGQLAVIAAALILNQLLEVGRRQLVEAVGTGFERDTRVRMYGHLLRLDLTYFQKRQVGGIYGRVNRSIEGTSKLLKLSFLDFLPTLILAGAAIVVALSRNFLVGMTMFAVVPTGLLLVAWQIRNQSGIRVTVRDHKEDIDGQVVELLPALETVRATNAQDSFQKRITVLCSRLRDVELRHHRAMSFFDAGKAVNEALHYATSTGFSTKVLRAHSRRGTWSNC